MLLIRSFIMIRLALSEEIDILMSIYHYAQDQMIRNGNPDQWGHTNPTKEMILEDIEKSRSYVITDDTGVVHGVFVLLTEEEPTYRVIEGGEWLNNELYVTIHRIASDGQMHGIFEKALAFAEGSGCDVRIDTHKDNLIMQKLIERNGFKRCGIIYLMNGSPRIAYQKVIRQNKDNRNQHA